MIRRPSRYGRAGARPWRLSPGLPITSSSLRPERGWPLVHPSAPASQRIDAPDVAARTHVTATRAVRWNVRAHVTSSRTIRWAVKARVTAARLVRWAVRARVTASRTIRWAVRARVTSARRLVWGDRARIYAARTLRWSIRARVASLRNVVWSLRARVTAARLLSWQVQGRTHVTASRTLSWQVEGAEAPPPPPVLGGGGGLTGEWKLPPERVRVEASVLLGWMVEAPHPPSRVGEKSRPRRVREPQPVAALTAPPARRPAVHPRRPQPRVIDTPPVYDAVRERDDDEAVAILLAVME